MKIRLFTILFLLVATILALSWMGTPGEQGLVQAESDQPAANLPVTLNINLGSEPATLDPALVWSPNAVEQLFIGLVDLDDETGEVIPELASSWNVSPDSRVYTFTLRDDILWTDGTPVTAHDVAYGILRSLNPATGADYAYVLYIIENAQDYNAGSIQDPEQVGVKALDDNHLQIRLHEPAVYLPSILAIWVAWPVPQAVIEKWGDKWTEPANIVTNGAYRLKEWVHEDHIMMEKNPTYFDAAGVQIEQIKMHMVDDVDSAWQMYLDGKLDTAYSPDVTPDPIINQEVQKQFRSCTYYYGFVNNKPPFNDSRVRKAFALSVNKENIPVRDATPANHFAPPGIWGTPAIGSVGLAYNPWAARTLLQSYLDEKGMTLADFNALDITLMHTTSEGHANIAASVQQEWADNLGVSVIVEDLPWRTYLKVIQKDTPLEDVPHIFRLGWCADYADENNWVHEVFNNQASANRLRRGCTDDTCTSETPLQFDQLTEMAKAEQDPGKRKNLYFQAEQQLAEVEAAYLPLYFYGSTVATKPYLERTYPSFAGYDIANWRITRVCQAIETSGGTVDSDDGSITLHFPSAAYSRKATICLTPVTGVSPNANQVFVSDVFDISAVDYETGQPLQLAPGKEYRIMVKYSKGGAVEDTLALYYWNNDQWIKEPTSFLGDGRAVWASPNHHSQWVVMGRTYPTFLPAAIKSY